jgi:NAD(P)-dependent dehydrogenase (short-subunit alcohol dehydrogenase family)
VDAAVALAVKTFGGIDVLVNNASAISLTRTVDTPMKVRCVEVGGVVCRRVVAGGGGVGAACGRGFWGGCWLPETTLVSRTGCSGGGLLGLFSLAQCAIVGVLCVVPGVLRAPRIPMCPQKYDLMHQVNGRGTFLVSQKCIPHLVGHAELSCVPSLR